MTDLERRAQLGDREAQEECTRQGIVLPCPCCGKEAVLKQLSGRWAVCCSRNCVGSRLYNDKQQALAEWNTRQGPPIGRCGDCAYSQNVKSNGKGFNICPASGMEITNEDFCSYFEPKAQKKEANHETD